MNNILLNDLLRKNREGVATEEEALLLQNWYLFESGRTGAAISSKQLQQANTEIWKNIKKNTELETKVVPFFKRWNNIIAASVAIILVSAALFFYQTKNNDKQAVVAPGTDQATLTLGDGRIIALDKANKGALIDQDGSLVLKQEEGVLTYSKTTKESNSVAKYHTLKTPTGGQYTIELPDGSKVMLNAASSLKYPSTFSFLKERKVVLSGEAYFDIIKDSGRPFKVISGDQEVTVLGTRFNINSYPDEPTIRTTLAEGSLRVVNLNDPLKKFIILKPGEQSELSGTSLTVNQVEGLEKELAWVEGDFRFNNLGLKGFLRTVGRWYDVDIYYDGPIPDINYGGSISRKTEFSTLLSMMEYMGYVDFKLEGRKLIVSKAKSNRASGK